MVSRWPLRQRQSWRCHNKVTIRRDLFGGQGSLTNRGVISELKRIVTFGFACVGAMLLITGCETSKPRPVPTEKPAEVPAPPQPPAATSTNVFREPISRPRPPADAADNMPSNILAWDATENVYQAKRGETNAPFTFALTNISAERVMIFDTSTTCECTVARLPSKPWTLQPGASGEIHASLDIANRTGDAVTNYVIVFTSKGNRLLTVKAVLPK
jgi:hypothetical protein